STTVPFRITRSCTSVRPPAFGAPMASHARSRGARTVVRSVVACGLVDADKLWSFIRDIPDFPQPGVVFRDITPLLGDAAAFRAATELLAAPFDGPVTKVIGIEARGFILAAPIAL